MSFNFFRCHSWICGRELHCRRRRAKSLSLCRLNWTDRNFPCNNYLCSRYVHHNFKSFLASVLCVTVSLSTDANDFTLEDDRILVFSAVSSQQCFDIEIVPDDFVENDETFSLSIETTNNAVILAPATTLIIIRNDDCKLLSLHS